jgi:hypothetical protein
VSNIFIFIGSNESLDVQLQLKIYLPKSIFGHHTFFLKRSHHTFIILEVYHNVGASGGRYRPSIGAVQAGDGREAVEWEREGGMDPAGR